MANEDINHRMPPLSSLCLELELEQTYRWNHEPRNQDNCDDLVPRSPGQSWENRVALQSSGSPADIQDAISANTSNTREGAFLSIYGGSNGIWVNTSPCSHCDGCDNDLSTCRSRTFERTVLRSLRRDFKLYPVKNDITKHYSTPSV